MNINTRPIILPTSNGRTAVALLDRVVHDNTSHIDHYVIDEGPFTSRLTTSELIRRISSCTLRDDYQYEDVHGIMSIQHKPFKLTAPSEANWNSLMGRLSHLIPQEITALEAHKYLGANMSTSLAYSFGFINFTIFESTFLPLTQSNMAVIKGEYR